MLFAWVWRANVGGLFAALGVTSIVLGFALQNAVGSIISGLLLLFEQPFHLGDWLDDGTVRGRVVEVNWRAVHIETANGVQIVPNATLAGASFTNLSQPAGRHAVTVATKFAAGDPPDVVCRLLNRVAIDLPIAGIEPQVSTAMTGPQAYATTIAIRSPADADDVTATFLRWSWYAARRGGLHLDGVGDTFSTPERASSALRDLAPSLHLRDEEIETVAGGMHVERWATGELLQRVGDVPDAMRFVLRGRVELFVIAPGGDHVRMGELATREILGLTSLTRQPALIGAAALDELEVLAAPVTLVEDLVHSHPALARELGRQLDLVRVRVQQRLDEFGDGVAAPALASATLNGQAAVAGARRGPG